ncbi:MAG: hypothetical protein AWU57_4073 [Marinobacter sp. T13-3]|nr:MAG: hypothetical protein AWU57_4073 [Marinobacter sp. T13-3]
MPMIGWLFILGAFAILLLKDAGNIKVPKEKLEKVRQRKAEAEKEDEREREQKDDW